MFDGCIDDIEKTELLAILTSAELEYLHAVSHEV